MGITEAEREALYKTIYSRRDARGEFRPDSINEAVLQRILRAAHNAPSVGFMQPWDFIVVRDSRVRTKVKACFVKAHEEAAQLFEGEQRETGQSLKPGGILDAPVGPCIACDHTCTGPVAIGRPANPEMDRYSSVCAVQNFWLAARAENLGVGWVSIIHHDDMRDALGIPAHTTPVANLCIGKVDHFHEKHELGKAGWLPRLDLETLTHYDRWNGD